MFRLLILFLSCWQVIACGNNPTVEIPNGKIQGSLLTSYRGRTYMRFDGIPYAKPPIGNLRFEEAEAATSWDDILIANKKVACAQVLHTVEPVGGQSLGVEDCLFLYVSVPGEEIKPKNNYDVLVHIHGGSFSFGSGSSVGGRYLMDRDVILVSMNYRVGLFGFLSTEDEHVPGNLGFKDQVLALQWIRDNIAYFGGNPESITITGLSAGAISVHYHMLSPLSKGLFHRAIAMSGSSMRTHQALPREKAMTLGKHFDCPLVPTESLIACLKLVPEGDMLEATRLFRSWVFYPFAPFGPVVDKWSDKPFLPQHPQDILKSKKFNDVPLISSSVAEEGLYPGAEFIYKDSYLIEFDARWDELAPVVLMYQGKIPEIESVETTRLIREQYFANEPINRDAFPALIRLFSDKFFNLALDKSLRLHVAASMFPVYSYRFNYTAEEIPSFSGLFTDNHERLGVSHGDDAAITFEYDHFQEDRRTPRDEKITDFFLDLYMHFIKTGTVHVKEWKPVCYEPNEPINFLQIQGPEPENMQMQYANLGNAQFWDYMTFELF